MAIAIALMIIINFYIFDKHSWHEDIKAEYYAEQDRLKKAEEERSFDPVAEDFYAKNPPKMVYPENGSLYFESAE
ncbi:MAG: hypothetical protein AAF988_02325 [Pseudomonadota bacterium]